MSERCEICCDCDCHREPNPFVRASYEDDACGRCGHGGNDVD